MTTVSVKEQRVNKNTCKKCVDITYNSFLPEKLCGRDIPDNIFLAAKAAKPRKVGSALASGAKIPVQLYKESQKAEPANNTEYKPKTPISENAVNNRFMVVL